MPWKWSDMEDITLREAGLQERRCQIHIALRKVWANSEVIPWYVQDDITNLDQAISRYIDLVEKKW